MIQRAASLILILILTLMSLSVKAEVAVEDCDDTDMSDRFVPPRDQGQAGFCYSFTAADLLAEAAGVKPPNTVSAFHTATQYVSMTSKEVEEANKAIKFEALQPPKLSPPNDGIPFLGGMGNGLMGSPPSGGMGMGGFAGMPDPRWRAHNPKGKGLLLREGGQTDLIASHMITTGKLCLEREVPSQKLLRSERDSEQQQFFTMKLATMAGGEIWGRGKVSADAKPELTSEQQEFISKMGSVRGNGNFKNREAKPAAICMNQDPSVFEFKSEIVHLNSAVQDWGALLLRKQTDLQCKNPVSLDPNLKVHSKNYNAFSMMMPQKNDEESNEDIKKLMADKRPFALHYDVCVLVNCKGTKLDSGAGWHASMVVGRRWNKNKNKCELMIKNSWGKNCENALPSVECKDGYWWVDQEQITSRHHEIMWIDKK